MRGISRGRRHKPWSRESLPGAEDVAARPIYPEGLQSTWTQRDVDDAIELEQLQHWVGRQHLSEDTLGAFPLRALKATLEAPYGGDGEPGDVLPPLWHWLYFLPFDERSSLGPDGHAHKGGFLPPVPLPRRMWAGGRFGFMAPLRIGETVSRRSTIWSVRSKRGRSGPLVFVTVRHQFEVDEQMRLWEEHDIVYRSSPAANEAGPAPVPAGDGDFARVVVPDEVMLFRYSALTFNGHRIHYDRRYATSVDAYPGLVAHGPLIATLLLDLLQREMPGIVLHAFSYRARRPAFDGRPLSVHGAREPEGGAVRLWARDDEGWLVMEATASLA